MDDDLQRFQAAVAGSGTLHNKVKDYITSQGDYIGDGLDLEHDGNKYFDVRGGGMSETQVLELLWTNERIRKLWTGWMAELGAGTAR
jgi:hypothetical protein